MLFVINRPCHPAFTLPKKFLRCLIYSASYEGGRALLPKKNTTLLNRMSPSQSPFERIEASFSRVLQVKSFRVDIWKR